MTGCAISAICSVNTFGFYAGVYAVYVPIAILYVRCFTVCAVFSVGTVLAVGEAEMEALLQVARANGSRVVIGHVLRYTDFYRSIKERVAAGELGEILSGDKCARENDDEIIYFNPVGAGVLDMIIVHRCYQNALREGKGQKLVFWQGDE